MEQLSVALPSPSAAERRGLWGWIRSWLVRPEPKSEVPPGVKLLDAARRGDKGMVKALLARGTPPDETRSRFRVTALSLAANGGHRAVARALLKAGADLGAEDCSGTNALIRAAAGGYAGIIRLMATACPSLLKSWSAAAALRHATLAGHSCAIRALLMAGTRADARAPGYPSAIFAAAITDASCVAELLDGGADPNETDQHGQTPLHYASAASEHESIRLLLVAGAVLEARDYDGRTARDLATTDLVRNALIPLPPTAGLNRAERVVGP